MAADLEPITPTGSHAQGRDRVEDAGGDHIRNPYRVIAKIIERIDESQESRGIVGCSLPCGHANPYFHARTVQPATRRRPAMPTFNRNSCAHLYLLWVDAQISSQMSVGTGV